MSAFDTRRHHPEQSARLQENGNKMIRIVRLAALSFRPCLRHKLQALCSTCFNVFRNLKRLQVIANQHTQYLDYGTAMYLSQKVLLYPHQITQKRAPNIFPSVPVLPLLGSWNYVFRVVQRLFAGFPSDTAMSSFYSHLKKSTKTKPKRKPYLLRPARVDHQGNGIDTAGRVQMKEKGNYTMKGRNKEISGQRLESSSAGPERLLVYWSCK